MAKVKLIDFWAPWCGPCRAMAPVIKEIESEVPDLELQEINADEHPEETSKYGVMGLPTYIIMKDDKEVGRKIGITPKADLLKLIKA